MFQYTVGCFSFSFSLPDQPCQCFSHITVPICQYFKFYLLYCWFSLAFHCRPCDYFLLCVYFSVLLSILFVFNVGFPTYNYFCLLYFLVKMSHSKIKMSPLYSHFTCLGIWCCRCLWILHIFQLLWYFSLDPLNCSEACVSWCKHMICFSLVFCYHFIFILLLCIRVCVLVSAVSLHIVPGMQCSGKAHQYHPFHILSCICVSFLNTFLLVKPFQRKIYLNLRQILDLPVFLFTFGCVVCVRGRGRERALLFC